MFLLCLATYCTAGDTVVAPTDTAAEAHQQVQAVRDRVVAQASKLDAIEHYLSDQALVQAGKAPKGWVQPELWEYAEPDAPASFLPQAVAMPAPESVPPAQAATPLPSTWSTIGPTQ